MKYIALKDLPQGQRPGDEFETTEAMGGVLELVGAAKKKPAAPAVVAKVVTQKSDIDPEPTAATQTPRRYTRRDLQASET